MRSYLRPEAVRASPSPLSAAIIGAPVPMQKCRQQDRALSRRQAAKRDAAQGRT
jgi:hypothetical protein